MIRLVVVGPHTQIHSSLCASCPHSDAGCCVGPPRLDWSDLGRIVSLGGRDWLLAEIAAGRVVPCDGGLEIQKKKGLARPGGARLAKCVYHAEMGCTIGHERRSATCNYYVCETVFAEGGPEAPRARALHAELARTFEAWDREMGPRLAAAWPDGPPFDAPFLDALGAEFEERSHKIGAPRDVMDDVRGAPRHE